VAVRPDDDQETLAARLTDVGVPLLTRVLRWAEQSRLPREPQDHARATFAPALKKQDGRLDWSRPAVELHNLVRGCHPWPGAYTTLAGRSLRIMESEVVPDSSTGEGQPGTLGEEGAHGGFLVTTGAGRLRVLAVQAEGRRQMSAAEFLRGARLSPGTVLGCEGTSEASSGAMS
jgi:methionyl-tRNA formyltransferase